MNRCISWVVALDTLHWRQCVLADRETYDGFPKDGYNLNSVE